MPALYPGPSCFNTGRAGGKRLHEGLLDQIAGGFFVVHNTIDNVKYGGSVSVHELGVSLLAPPEGGSYYGGFVLDQAFLFQNRP